MKMVSKFDKQIRFYVWTKGNHVSRDNDSRERNRI